jgi:spoIIIJ-associated protein
MVDVNGYQLSRIRDLEQKARLLADRVRTFRSSAEMTPMTAYERMIVHSLFSNDPEITTESDGTGKMRHVILRYKV